MSENIKSFKIDGVCKAGCVLTIVLSSLSLFICVILSIVFMFAVAIIPIMAGVVVFIFIILSLIYLSILLLSINLLMGKTKSKISTGVLSLIFLGLIGGILILVGEYTPASTDGIDK